MRRRGSLQLRPNLGCTRSWRSTCEYLDIGTVVGDTEATVSRVDGWFG